MFRSALRRAQSLSVSAGSLGNRFTATARYNKLADL